LISFAAEDLIEGRGELAVAVVDQKSHPFEQAGEAEVARLLGHPGAARIRGAASEMDAAASEFEEEEHVEAAQRQRLDGEKVAGEHAGRLLTQELPPARACTPRRRPRAGGKQDPPDRVRRHTQAELEQFAGDPRVTPTWVPPAKRSTSWRMRSSTSGRPALLRGCVHLRRTSSRCQRSRVCGVTPNPWRRRGGSRRASAASNARSAGRSNGRRCCRPSTAS
jgi:hypothetical protein